MSGPSDRRGGWRIEFGQGGPRRPGTPGGPRGPRGPLRPTGGGGDGDGDDPRGPIRPPLSPQARKIAWTILFVILIVIAVFLRPLLHTPLMWIWRAPLPWIAALIVLGLGRLAGNRARLTVADLQAGRYPGRGVWASSFAIAGLVFFILQAVNPLLVQRSLSKTEFTSVQGLPETGIVRLVPKEVADRTLTGSFNSSTERLLDPRVINTKDGLQWSAIRTPEGLVRRYSKKGGGLILQNAQSLSRQSDQIDATFKYSPGLAVFDSLTWQLRERKLLADLTDPVGIVDDNGAPLILVPYVTYTGFPIRKPKLGGAFLVHPGGRIEDLSPSEAAANSVIRNSGRLYPDTLARKVQDSYALRGGIWNYLFLHNNQTKITDTELNRQPYLLQGPDGKNLWVSVAEPYGRAQATNAVFLTDSTTGKTDVWKVPGEEGLTGNARALRVTRSLAIPGVTFGQTDLRTTGGGAFRAVEPRPVFIKGSLYFVVSVIPDNAESVSKTVIINATTNRAEKVFDTDEAGTAETLAFLKNGPTDANTGTSGGDATATTPSDPTATTPSAGSTSGSGSGKAPTQAELRKRVDDAIDEQQRALDGLKNLQRDLAGTTP